LPGPLKRNSESGPLDLRNHGDSPHATEMDYPRMAGDVLRFIKDQDLDKAGILGHSMGGAVGVVRASSDQRISLLVSLAGMVHTEAFAQREFGEETPDAGLMWEEDACPLSRAYMDDMAQIDSVVGLAEGIARLHGQGRGVFAAVGALWVILPLLAAFLARRIGQKDPTRNSRRGGHGAG